MNIATVYINYAFFFLLVVTGIIEVTGALSSATLPDTLSWLTSYGGLLVVVTAIGALATGVISLLNEQRSAG